MRFFQGKYRLIVGKADNRYLEVIFIHSKSENIGAKILDDTNSNTKLSLNVYEFVY